jgi:integrase/recombinase XerD
MLPKFQQFIRERQYLKNVSPATVAWHTHNLKWLKSESPSQAELNDAVIRMREKGLRATGCNSAIRSINAYLRWIGSECHLQQMKEPQLILPIYTTAQVKLLVSWKPRGFYEQRLHLMILILLDTGCRITEALTIHITDCDLDNLLVTLDGKGSKQRKVPISLNLRRQLYVWTKGFRQDDFVLATRNGQRLDRHIMLRDVKRLCFRLGFKPPAKTLHACRHTYATHYIQSGGNVVCLQRLLGHSHIETTMRYVHIQTQDLQTVHERHSLLAA